MVPFGRCPVTLELDNELQGLHKMSATSELSCAGLAIVRTQAAAGCCRKQMVWLVTKAMCDHKKVVQTLHGTHMFVTKLYVVPWYRNGAQVMPVCAPSQGSPLVQVLVIAGAKRY